MAKIETLVDDIQALFEGKDLSERIHHLTSKLGDSFVSKFMEYAEERKPTLRMSNLGRPNRQLWYELRGYKGEKLSAESKFKYLYGSLLEDLILHLASETGHEVTNRQERIEVDGVVGHIDCVIDGVLVDVKSASPRSFDKFKDGSLERDDPFGYIAQLNGYAKALGIERAAFLAIDKVSGEICLHEVKVGDYDIQGRIKEVRECLSSDEPPPHCYDPVPDGKSGNEKLSVGCSYCSFKTECWKDVNDGEGLKVFLYSTGPRYLTKVVRQPKVDEFEKFPIKKEEQ